MQQRPLPPTRLSGDGVRQLVAHRVPRYTLRRRLQASAALLASARWRASTVPLESGNERVRVRSRVF